MEVWADVAAKCSVSVGPDIVLDRKIIRRKFWNILIMTCWLIKEWKYSIMTKYSVRWQNILTNLLLVLSYSLSKFVSYPFPSLHLSQNWFESLITLPRVKMYPYWPPGKITGPKRMLRADDKTTRMGNRRGASINDVLKIFVFLFPPLSDFGTDLFY